MEEKELQNVSSETTGSVDNNQYIDALNQLKQNSVDRSKYEALQAENKKLLDSIVNGLEIDVEAEPKETVQELRNELFVENSGLNNLEYAQKALALRDALIAKGENDPFVPIGRQYQPTNEDIQTAEKVANVLQECIEYAEGDSQVFTNELQRRMINTKI